MVNTLMLACVPMSLALLGGWLDERRALGFTVWRSACRAAGLSPSSIATFTLELIPTAVIGALLGCFIVLLAGLRRQPASAHGAVAAHAGCVVAMPVGLILCASALPWPLTLLAEGALAALAAAGVWWLTRIRRATYREAHARVMPRIPGAAAADENSSA
jgi:hypothetical protein